MGRLTGVVVVSCVSGPARSTMAGAKEMLGEASLNGMKCERSLWASLGATSQVREVLQQRPLEEDKAWPQEACWSQAASAWKVSTGNSKRTPAQSLKYASESTAAARASCSDALPAPHWEPQAEPDAQSLNSPKERRVVTG